MRTVIEGADYVCDLNANLELTTVLFIRIIPMITIITTITSLIVRY